MKINSKSDKGRSRTPDEEGGVSVVSRCQSWVRLNGDDFACGFPASSKHDECQALVRADNGQDVAVKWRKR